MASGNGVGNALHSGKQELGPGRITKESTCSSLQVGLSTKGDVRIDHPKVQGQISRKGISTRIWRRLRRNHFTSGENDNPSFHARRRGADNLKLIQLDEKTTFLHGDL